MAPIQNRITPDRTFKYAKKAGEMVSVESQIVHRMFELASQPDLPTAKAVYPYENSSDAIMEAWLLRPLLNPRVEPVVKLFTRSFVTIDGVERVIEPQRTRVQAENRGRGIVRYEGVAWTEFNLLVPMDVQLHIAGSVMHTLDLIEIAQNQTK